MPTWRKMPIPQFLIEFAQTIRVADRVQPALLVASIVSSPGFALSAGEAARTIALFGAAGFVVTMIASAAVLVPLQRRIVASPSGEVEAVEAMRRRWFSGHLGRSALATACYTLVVIAAVV